MLEYLKDKILDELKDSVDYMRKAVETKGKPVSELLCKLSMTEAEHANCLYKHFMYQIKSDDSSEEKTAKMIDEVLDSYTTNMGLLESLKKLYFK